MSATTTLSSSFRICVPKEIRDEQNWKARQKLAFVQSERGLLLVAVPSLKDLGGLASGAD